MKNKVAKESGKQELLRQISLLNEKANSLQDEKDQLIKQLEKVNSKLTESEAFKTHFLSNIKNEINNPIAAISGLSKSLIKLNDNNVEKIKKMVGHIFTEISQIDFHMSNIFIAAELEAGNVLIESISVEVPKMIRNITESYIEKVNQKNIKISTEFCQNSVAPFSTDASKLYIILNNLISNAVEHSKEGQSIEISVKKGEKLNINIQDSGVGIANAEKMFDRFNQLNTGLNRNHKGQGLGLAVTKELLELLSGEMVVQTVPGGGTLIAIQLPELSSPTEASNDGAEFLFNMDEKF